jgi:lipopolysaccharide/colanic/teichoic acid biosynthesis glycosyltransferase
MSSPALAASPAMMSLQATYSNLVGLAFLVTLSPLLVALAVLSRIAAGPGPMLDRVECAGFQGIPFQRLYFRTRSQTGELSWAGKIISTLRLTGLPQLINLVRGEMAMFGPAPARAIFSGHLSKTIPPYSHRLSMRPGVLGWAQVHQRVQQGLREEVLQLEYDLYYIKQCSPSLDFEILLRTLLRVPYVPRGGQT